MPIWSPALFFASASEEAYVIQDSVMLDGSADYLTLTPSFDALDNTKVTFSWWQKRSTFSTVSWLYDAGSNNDQMQFAAADDLEVSLNATTDAYLNTTALFRDPTAWQHFVVSFDTGNSTSGDRMRIWNNGTEITAFDTDTMPSAGYALDFLANGIVQNLGRRGNNSQFWGGYLAEFIGLDGISVTDASKFGETNDDGIWIPKDPSDTDNIADWGGSNSFWLKFANATNLGFNSRPTALTANAGTYKIDNSLWLDGTADYLERTPSSQGSLTTYTLSFWAKVSNNNTSNGYIIDAGAAGANGEGIRFTGSSETPLLVTGLEGAGNTFRTTSAIYSDPSAWMHVVYVKDTANGNPDDRIKIFVNGARVTDFSATRTVPLNEAGGAMNTTVTHRIGANIYTSTPAQFYKGYLAEYIFLDGVAGTATDFGGWDANGNWLPVDPTSLDFTGNNSFYLDFAVAPGTSNGAGTDASGGGVKQDISGGTATNPGGGLHNFSGSGVLDDDTAQDGFYLTGDEAGQTVDVDLGSGNDLAVTGAGWVVENNGANDQAAVWSILYSDNGSDYTDTNQNLTVTDDGTSMSEQRALITGQSAHRYWRLSIDSTTATGNGWYSSLRLYSGGTGVSFLNTFTENSLAATQKTTDSPTNTSGDNEGNYTTFNFNDKNSNITLAGGDLTVTNTGSASFQGAIVTQRIPNSGKYYFEVTLPGTLSNQYIGVVNEANKWDFVTAVDGSTSAGFYGFYPVTSTSSKVDNGSTSSYGGSIGNGSVLGFAIDKDNDEMYVSDDGTFLASSNPVTRASPMLSSLPDNLYVAMTAHNSGGHSLIFNFGQTAFAGSIPSGYVRLDTSQLAAPTVTDPRAYWSNSLYYGTAQNHSVRQCFDSTGTAWTPDFVWIKNRTGVVASHHIYDVVRGVNKFIKPNTTDAENSSRSDMLTSFDSGGFSLGVDASEEAINKNNDSYVAWCMKAGGAASSNGNGSITSSVSAASHGGFSIGTFTAGSTGGVTIGHGLSRVPAMIIVKDLSATGQWWTYHEAMGKAKYLALQATTDEQSSTAVWNDTDPTATVFSTQDDGDWLTDGNNHVFYAFAKTPGLIGIGSYTGNNSTDGPCVVVDDGATGFRPAFLIIKEYSGSNNGNWFMRDSARNPYNPTDLDLYVNSTAIEYTDSNSDIDFTANGFKIRANAGGYNESGAKNLYIAFADQPFNLARAR